VTVVRASRVVSVAARQNLCNNKNTASSITIIITFWIPNFYNSALKHHHKTSMSTEDPMRLKKLNDDIEALMVKIKDFESGLTIKQIRNNRDHINYLTALHNELVELRKEKNSLLVPTPSTTDPEGNN
jgi:hypothetical protein